MAKISKIRFDGVTYDIKSITDTSLSKAGTPADAAAVRTHLKSAITPLTLTEPMLEWYLGKYVDNNGNIINNRFMALTGMFLCTGGDKIHRSTPEKDGKYALIIYINQYVSGVWKSRITIDYDDTITLDSDVNGVRLAFGRTASTDVKITQEDIDAFFKIDVYRQLVPMAEYLKDDEVGHAYRGNMSTLGITSFADCDKNGTYAFSAQYVSSIIDAPKDLSTAGIVYTITGLVLRQVIISAENIYYRAGVTGDWRRVSKNAVEYCGVINSSGDKYSFSDFKEINTYYGVRANYKEVCQDWPKNEGRNSGNFVILGGQYRNTSIKQYLIFSDGIYVRTGLYEEVETGSGVYAWNFDEWSMIGKTETAPPYWTDTIFDVCNAVNESRVTIAGTMYSVNSGLHGDRFVFITDTHWTYGEQQSPGIIYEIMRYIGRVKVIHGGDIVDGTLSNGVDIGKTPEENRAELLRRIRYYKRLLSKTKRELDLYEPMYYVVGNHEYMNPDRETQKKNEPEKWAFTKDYELTEDEAYKFAVTSMNEKIAVRNSVGDYYFDNVSQKIRYFFIGCDASAHMHSETPGWLNSCLTVMPEGYMAVIISHVGIYRNSATGETRMLSTFSGPDYYEDFKEGENTGNIKIWDVIDGVGKVLDNHYDRIAFVMSGHTHIDLEYRTINGVLIISTATDAWIKTRIDEDKDGETKEGGYNVMTPGTTSEQCFDVVSFDVASQVVVLVRVGAKTITQGSWIDLLGEGKGYARAYTFK